VKLQGGGGAFAIYLDKDLFHGASGPCPTFGSPTLASAADFDCARCELWALHRREL
jgi:hypothetical protein